MNDPHRDSPPPPDGFDPMRRRREIELMEQRFRERSGRSAGPLQTSDMDARVANEMHEFFSESQEMLQKVVPGLDEGTGNGMKETTGEIRRKIDDFFSQVKETGAGAAVPTPDTSGRKPKWSGMFPDQPLDQQRVQVAPQQEVPSGSLRTRDSVTHEPSLRGTPGSAANRAPTTSGRPAVAAEPAPQTVVIPSVPLDGPVAQSSFSPCESPNPASVPLVQDADAERPKMDLRTALERLKRHGVVRADAPAAVPRVASRPQTTAGRPPVAADVSRPRSSPPAPSAPSTASTASTASAPSPAAQVASQARRPDVTGPQGASRPSSHESGKHDTRTQTIQPAQPTAQHPTFPPRRDPTRSNLPSIRREVDIAQAPPPRRDQTRSIPTPGPGSSVGNSGPMSAPTSPARNAQPPSPAAARAPTNLPPSASAPYVSPALQPGAPPAGPAQASLHGPRPFGREPASAERSLPRRVIGDMELPPRASGVPMGAPAAGGARRVVSAGFGAADPSPAAAPHGARGAPTAHEAAASAPPPRAASAPVQSARPPAVSRPEPSVDAARAFDSIFSELEGLVRDTLKESVDQSFEAARVAEDEMSAVRSPTARTATVRPEAARPSAARPAAAPPASLRPAAERVPAPRAPAQRLAPVHESDAEDVPEVDELTPIPSRSPTPSAPAKGAPPVGRSSRIATPPADFGGGAGDAGDAEGAEDDEVGDQEGAAPAGPYNWGVRPAKTPPGAWLLGDEGAAAPAAAPAGAPATPRPRAAQPDRAAPPAPVARAPEPTGGGPGGGRGYLLKKLSDEVVRARPALRALKDRGVISDEDMGDAPSRSGGDDEDVSIDQFADRAEIDLEKELSPVRLVGELRKIRRVVDALIAKGVITAADLERSADE